MPRKTNSEEVVAEEKKTAKKAVSKKKSTDNKTVKKTAVKTKKAEPETQIATEEIKEESVAVQDTKAVTPDGNNEFEALLNKIAEDNEAQAVYAKKQYNMSRITAICSAVAMLVVLISALLIVPRVVGSLIKVETAVGELENVAKTLNEEVPALLESTAELIGDEDSGLVQAVGNFNKFDIETLNEAIGDLKATVEPLARLFGGR